MEVKAGLSENTNNSSNEESFQLLFQQHYPLVVRKILVIVKEQSIAEDIAQEVFVKLYRTDRNAIINLPAWLTKVAVTTAYNHIRTEKRHRARQDKQKMFGKKATSSVEDKYMEHEDIDEVQKSLMKLSERDRELLIMKFSGYSYEEIARHIGIEIGSVGTLLARAKQRFKQSYMEGRGKDQ